MQRASRFIAQVLRNLKYTAEFVDKVKPVASRRDGEVEFELRLEKEHCDLHGTLHSGMAFALLDLYTWAAACTLYEQDAPLVSLNLTARFISPARLGDVILMDTRIIHAGKSVAYAQMDILDKATKRLLVQGSHTIFILSRPVQIVTAQKGFAQFELLLEKEHCDLHGTMHNGMAISLIDLYTWATACTMYQKRTNFTSLNIQARFLAPATLGNVILMNTRVTHPGGKTAFVEMDILDKATEEILIQGNHTLFNLSR